MAQTPEGKVKDAIKKQLLAYGAYFTMPVKAGYGSNGELDFNIGLNGRRLDVEAKAGANQPSELQWIHIERITASGCSSLVIREDNLHLLEQWLRRVSDGALTSQLRVRPYRKAKGRGVEKHGTF